ncbi:MAG: class I SAM-dependent methyltransferase [Chloroflexota bacterium]
MGLRHKRLLDFGCGGGELLTTARALGMDVFGVEINPYQRRYLTERGLLVAPSLGEFTGQTFDVVVFSHVLEHIPSPQSLLLEVGKLLGGGGRLLLSMPNLSSYLARLLGRFWAGLQIDQHIWHFTPKTIAALVDRCGYDLEKVEICALGKGLSVDGIAQYGGAVALLDTDGSLVAKMLLLGLLVIDGLFVKKVGQAIRKYGETRGGDNMIVVAGKRGNAPT